MIHDTARHVSLDSPGAQCDEQCVTLFTDRRSFSVITASNESRNESDLSRLKYVTSLVFDPTATRITPQVQPAEFFMSLAWDHKDIHIHSRTVDAWLTVHGV